MKKSEIERELNAFEGFKVAEIGNFNGFEFANVFHSFYNKSEALEAHQSDDCANIITSAGAVIPAGADCVTVYIMTEAARRGEVAKTVTFNRSIYTF